MDIEGGRPINQYEHSWILSKFKFLDPGRSVGNIVMLSLYTALIVVEPLGFYIEYALNEELGCLEISRLWYLQFLHLGLNILLLFSILLQFTEKITSAEKTYIFVDMFVVLLSFAMAMSYYVETWRGTMACYVVYAIAFDIRILLMLRRFLILSRTSLFLYGHAWPQSVFIIILYLLGGHLIGGLWFTFAINEKLDCLKETLYKPSLDCRTYGHKTIDFMDDSCGQSGYGIYSDVFEYGYYKNNSLSRRYFYGFIWGVQNLMSAGANLQRNDVQSQSIFVLFISITSIILLMFVLGGAEYYVGQQMSRYRRSTELWSEINKLDSFGRLSNDIKLQFRRSLPSEWDGNTETVLYFVFKSIPIDLQTQIQEALCFERLRVIFNTWSDNFIKDLCRRAKPTQYVDGTVLMQQGDMIDEMIIFLSGRSQLTSSLHGQPGEVVLQEDTLIGRSLMDWVANGDIFAMPSSRVKVKAVTNIEAVKISAHDLKEIYDAANVHAATTQ